MKGWSVRSKWGLGLALCSLAGSPCTGILGWLLGWRFAVKYYSLEQGERDEVCVHSSGFDCALLIWDIGDTSGCYRYIWQRGDGHGGKGS